MGTDVGARFCHPREASLADAGDCGMPWLGEVHAVDLAVGVLEPQTQALEAVVGR